MGSEMCIRDSDYPDIIKQLVPEDRLVPFSDEEKALFRNYTPDFIGFNYFGMFFVQASNETDGTILTDSRTMVTLQNKSGFIYG